MDVVALGLAKVYARQQALIAAKALRQRSIPGVAGIIQLATSGAPTYARGVANAATQITSGVLFAASAPDAFTDMGAIGQPDASGFYLSNNNGQSLTSPSGTPPWAREFRTDADKLEVRIKGGGGPYQLAYNDGSGWKYATTPNADPGGSSVYLDLYTFATSTMRHFRLEMNGTVKFGGVYVGPTYTVQRASSDDAICIMGDSFTEPTIQDSSATSRTGFEGYAPILGKMLGYRNIIVSGSGGTGYLNPGTGGRVKFRDRVVADLINRNPAKWLICGGLNDANREPTYTAQMVHDEAVILFNQIKAALPYSEGGVFSPFCSGYPGASLLGCRDALKSAAASCGLPFYDVLGMTPPAQRIVTTLSADWTTGSSIQTPVNIPFGTLLQINTPAWGVTPGPVPLKLVSGSSGTGPFTINLTTAISAGPYPAGTAVVGAGYPWTYGTGRQGTTAGNGPNDIWIGSDATHPTIAGHAALGRACFAAMVEGVAH